MVVREPKFDGLFYPKDQKKLEDILNYFLKKVQEIKLDLEEKIIGIIVPHAGYVYSGLTAAYGYSIIPKNVKKFVIIGPNHTGYGAEVSIFPGGKWKTPLGEVEVDEEFVNKIIKNSKFAKKDIYAHLEEHSIEVQIPFLQYMLGNEIKIVPICLMNQSIEVVKDLAKALINTNEDFILIASSDLTHYESYTSVNEKDKKLIESVVSLDLMEFYSRIKKFRISACGYGCIATLMEITKTLKGKIKLLNHSTSAEKSKDYLNVVGYASLVSYIPKG